MINVDQIVTIQYSDMCYTIVLSNGDEHNLNQVQYDALMAKIGENG